MNTLTRALLVSLVAALLMTVAAVGALAQTPPSLFFPGSTGTLVKVTPAAKDAA
jgi:hypothetical protein